MANLRNEGVDFSCFVSSSDTEHILAILINTPKFATPNFDKSAYRDAIRKQLNPAKMEVRRFGGSNGLPVADYDFLKFLHTPGMLPRKALGCRFRKDNRVWTVLYKSPKQPYKNKFVRVVYAPPRPGGQVDPSKCKFPKSVDPFLEFYTDMKFMVPAMIESLIRELPEGKQFGIEGASRAQKFIKDELQASGNSTSVVRNAVKNSCIFTHLEYHVRLHYDVPTKATRIRGDFSFLEFKFAFEDSRSTSLLQNSPFHIARLRGGGRG